MKTFRWLGVLFLVAALAGCGDIYGVKTDHDKNADFNSLKKFNWLAVPAEVKLDADIQAMLKKAVDTELQTKGFMKTEDSPDFLIGMHTGSQTQTVYKSSAWSMYGVGQIVAVPYEEGTLVLDFLSTKSRQAVWRGSAKAQLQPEMTPAQKEKIINEAVKKILKKFPPK
mgnify:CR=1 FL=1